MFSYFEPNFVENFLRESGFSNFGQNQNDEKNRLFGRHFETVQHFNFLSRIMVFDSVYIHRTYMVQISLQNSGGKVGFLGAIPCQHLGCAPQHVMDFFLFKCGGR